METNETPLSASAKTGVSRRGFLGGMAATALGAATLASLSGCGQQAPASSAKGEEETTALASGNASFKEGTYTSTQHTPYATAEVTCTFDGTGLGSASYTVTATSEKDYFPLYAPALEELCETVAAAGKTAGVDAVSGATFCSNAILDGVDACTLQALEVTAPRPEQLNPQQAGWDTFEGTCDKVFSPIKLGTMELSNRVVKSAGSGVWADANKDKLPVAKELYGTMAENGVALNLLAGGNLSGFGILPDSLDKIDGTLDEALARAAELTDAIHAGGGKVGFQMCFGGLAPSVPDEVINETPVEDLDAFIDRVGTSAERAKTAGFDCIEIKGASADALNGFLTRRVNKREDEYGPQSIENRTRLFSRMIQKIKEVNGDDFPVGALINGVEENDSELGDNELFMTLDEGIEIAKAVEAAGADWIQVRVGAKSGEMNIWAPDVQHIAPGADGLTGYGTVFDYASHFDGVVDGSRSGFASFLPMVKAIKQQVSVPVGCAACLDLRLGPDYINEAIAQGDIDLVFMNRPLNCDPELVSKIQEGRRQDVRPCMKCMHCHDNIGSNRAVPSSCRMNASSFNSLTDTMPEGMVPTPAQKARKIMVVGAGPAGMEAARVAAERGHSVTLYDSEMSLGGLIPFAKGVKGGHERFDDYLTYMAAQLEKNGVDVQLGTTVDAALVKEQAPDAVVVATGGVRESRFSGANVLDPKDAFSPAATGDKVVVLGSGVQAIDFAAFLVSQGKSVVILNEGDAAALDKGQSGWFKSYMLPYLRSNGTQIHSNVQIASADGSGVTFKTAAGLDKTIACDSVVEFYDMQPNTALADELQKAGVEVYTVGDAAEPHNIQRAVTTGNLCARAL